MSFMKLQTLRGVAVLTYATGESECVDLDYAHDEACHMHADPEIEEYPTKWAARYSAPGYLDCTDWCGPFDTEAAAIAECRALFGDDEEYTFSELSDDAKQRAIDDARNAGWFGDVWAAEWHQSLTKGAELVGWNVGKWQIDPCGSSFCRLTWRDDNVAELRGVRLWKWIMANVAPFIAETCPFTGYCGDESLLDPLRAFLVRPDLSMAGEQLANECGQSWATQWARDIEDQNSDESIADSLEANGYEFTEDGERA